MKKIVVAEERPPEEIKNLYQKEESKKDYPDLIQGSSKQKDRDSTWTVVNESNFQYTQLAKTSKPQKVK